MNVQFKNHDGGITGRLQERLERKLAKLSQLTDTKEAQAVCYVEVERSIGSHHTGDVWQAIITITSEGTRYRAEELADTADKAADKAFKEIRSEIQRERGKKRALMKREGGFWKSFRERLTA